MDMNVIQKMADRKRLNTGTEELRQKVSRETEKIIKLKVAQDTAYWDLKEKLRQVEGNHEKLQQNMVEVQMQHEAVSGQYQEELRLRHDTLNKVNSTREMCDVLEAYYTRLKDSLSSCRADQAALGEAYRAAGQQVRELRVRHRDDAEAARRNTAALEDKVKFLTVQQNQLVPLFSAAKQQADAQNSDLRAQLAAARAHEQELTMACAELARAQEQCKQDLEKKEDMISNLQAEMKNMMQDFNKQATEARAVFVEQDKQLNVLKEENQSLKKAVDNQDEFIKSICDEKNALQEKIAALEEEQLALVRTNEELKTRVEIIADLELEIKNLEAKYTTLEEEKSELIVELNKVGEESNARAVEIQTLTSLTEDLQLKLSLLDADFKTFRDAAEEKNKEFSASIEAKDTELDYKACTITKLMSDVKKLEDAKHKIEREIEIERIAILEKEKRMGTTISQLETSVRDKEDRLKQQMSITMELKNEKERLLEEIQKMRTAMDNIQKELTRPSTQPAARFEPELDDNAVMLSSRKVTQLQAKVAPQQPAPAQFKVPRAHDLDDIAYHIFSDSSNDAHSLDPEVVEERFNALARGERLSPVPLTALTRRHKRQHSSVTSNTKIVTASASQNQTQSKNRPRKFFKSKLSY